MYLPSCFKKLNVFLIVFAATNKTLEWSMRVRVASYVAEALEYCINEGQALYFDLNSYKVLFNEVILVIIFFKKLIFR